VKGDENIDDHDDDLQAAKEQFKAPSSAEIPWSPDVWGWADENTVELEFEFSAMNPMNIRLQKPARWLVTFKDGEAVDYTMTSQ